MIKIKIGSFQKKILALLLGHLVSGLTYAPGQRRNMFKSISKELTKIDDSALSKAISSLCRNKLIDIKEDVDGRVKIILNENGRKRALEYQLGKIELKKPKHWDGKWRMIMFDIPNAKKRERETFRSHLKRLGFYQYQRSVFVHPYDARNEINFLIEFYGLRPYVRQLDISKMDNDLRLKIFFKEIL